jgi:hypothetical protein
MDTSRDPSRFEEPTSQVGEDPLPQTRVPQREHVHISTHVELRPEVAWSQQNVLSLGTYVRQ